MPEPESRKMPNPSSKNQEQRMSIASVHSITDSDKSLIKHGSDKNRKEKILKIFKSGKQPHDKQKVEA